ncbi:unnamed protein product, partial [Laminaria digitata]
LNVATGSFSAVRPLLIQLGPLVGLVRTVTTHERNYSRRPRAATPLLPDVSERRCKAGIPAAECECVSPLNTDPPILFPVRGCWLWPSGDIRGAFPRSVGGSGLKQSHSSASHCWFRSDTRGMICSQQPHLGCE